MNQGRDQKRDANQDPRASASHSTHLPALTNAEIAGIAGEMQEMVGAQLQECLQSESEVGLAFYHGGETRWLWFDLHPLRPWVVRLVGKPPPRKKIQRPLSLFIRSRFLGRRLASVRADIVRGRILVFAFHRAKDEDEQAECEIEVRLFPHGQNVIARDGARSIAELKPKPVASAAGGFESETNRSWPELEDAWLALQKQKPKGVSANRDDAVAVEKEWRRALEKKSKALEKMRDELAKKTSTLDAEVGEWLKTHGTLELPVDWPQAKKDAVDRSQSLSWNIEACFHRAKEGARKSAGTRARLSAVEKELHELQARGPSAFERKKASEEKATAENLLNRAEARGRRHKIGADLEVYIGKSAADNLALLRKSQPFDYWLHLRERPGSHAIIRRTRGRIVNDAEFVEAGRWVVEQSTGKRASELKGERFDLLIVECRFVRPIKSDKLGRVNYTNDRVMTLRF